MKLSREEVKWLKGYTPEELKSYMKEHPSNIESTKEFQERYTYSYRNNKWKRN
jgi:hypothetical protein